MTEAEIRDHMQQLSGEEDDDLFQMLGRHQESLSRTRSHSASAPQTRGAGEEDEESSEPGVLQQLGREYFERVSVSAYDLVCGSAKKDEDDRNRILQSFTNGKESVAQVIATIVVAKLGLPIASAVVVATLLVRLFFKPGHGAMCTVWKSRLSNDLDNAVSSG